MNARSPWDPFLLIEEHGWCCPGRARLDAIALGVEVPSAFREIGYSGLFWLEVPLADEVDAAAMAARSPFLAAARGWMVLSVDVERRVAIMVRRDADATVEALLRPAAHGRE